MLNGGGRKSCHIKMQKQNGTKLNEITEWEWKEIKTLVNQSVSKAYWVSSTEEIKGYTDTTVVIGGNKLVQL